MTYSEVTQYLFHRLPMFSRMGPPAFKKDLSNITALCEALGNPQRRFKTIHVGGTNGKGSVSHMLAAIFQQSGYKTGLHTSPHLVDFRERIRIDGKMTTEKFVIDFVEKNKKLIAQIKPSFFEISVAMAFQWFADHEVDIAIVEVGLGGRLDSTNILHPELAVITNISLEHTEILGDTLAKIAEEKAGIIKPQTPVVIGETKPETQTVFVAKAEKKEAELYFADQCYQVESTEMDKEGQWVKVTSKTADKPIILFLDLAGGYQWQNLQTVLTAVDVLRKKGWKLSPQKVKMAMIQVKELTGLRGRWDILSEDPFVIADTSHNEAGLKQVLKQIDLLAYKKLHLVIGFVKDKEVHGILSLFPTEALYYFCQADNPRKLPVKDLQQLAEENGLKGKSYNSVNEAVRAAKIIATGEDVILVTGSTFIVAEALV